MKWVKKKKKYGKPPLSAGASLFISPCRVDLGIPGLLNLD